MTDPAYRPRPVEVRVATAEELDALTETLTLAFREDPVWSWGFSVREEARPSEPHYYLSLLGTHPGRSGGGWGMGLLADNLARIDAEGAAAYLESSNPANVPRYERLGFAVFDEFTVSEGIAVAQMWREPTPL